MQKKKTNYREDDNGVLYDKYGFDSTGFNKNGYDIYGFDSTGLNKDGYDIDGFDKNGFNKDGLNRYVIKKNQQKKILKVKLKLAKQNLLKIKKEKDMLIYLLFYLKHILIIIQKN